MSELNDIAEARSEDPEGVRDALVGQMRYLIEEVEALRTVVDSVPEEVRSNRPGPGELTMKELYGALATLDRDVRRTWVDRVVNEEEPRLSPVDIEDEVRGAGWSDQEIETVLDRVTEARRELLETLESIPVDAWHRSAVLDGDTVSLFELVRRMTQTDLERLRELGYRLHGAHLSDRDEPLPT